MNELKTPEQAVTPATAKTFYYDRRDSGLVRIGRFLAHWLEMCAAMCIGAMLLGALFYWTALQLGYSDPLRQFPELTTIIAAFNMTVPMAAWMRFRGMEWVPIAEMSAAMLIETILLIGAAWLGFLPKSGLLVWQHSLMMPVMLIPMLFRLNLYTEHAGHHMHHVT